jgi:resuscitation-promoting factor RpfB
MGLGTVTTVALIGAAATIPSTPTAHKTSPAPSQQMQSAVQADTTEIKQITETQDIPFATKTLDDATITKGQTKVVQTGHVGTKTFTYKVTYTNGSETNRELISEQMTTAPVDQIVHNGTYVAPLSCSYGYINVDGNCVRSPSSDPAGATAQCVDGTYSYSQHRSGTCSHHGGVARWL